MLDKATALHLVNRLGFGPKPGDVEQIASMGMEAFLDCQLHPDIAQLPPDVSYVLQSLPTFGLSAADAYAQYWTSALVPDPTSLPKEERKKLKRRQQQVARDARVARLARAIGSPWQL